MFIRLVFSLNVACALFSSAAAAQNTIKVVADQWVPFGSSDHPNGRNSLDVISTVLERASYNLEAEIVPWERALDSLKTGTYDVVGNLFQVLALVEYLTFSDPFYDTEVHFLQKRDANNSFTNVDSLKPYTIAVGAGYLSEGSFDRANFLKKKEVTTVIQGVRMVANERVDLTLDSVDVLNYVIAHEAPELSEMVEYLPNRLNMQAIHMVVCNGLQGRDVLLENFNRVLAEMLADDSPTELLSKQPYYAGPSK
ncbi:ABC transporter substrate-binding protein [uncultured Roseovarius sp.]|uniref:substrate-binding periplasmic protein n=1 Tax=uncultured Roseovarius sp. TaxID=293344 RepID=UPI0026318C01|nr:transporter substrate-binding domain-containing protein [uncultured Roseovarius sp.]